MNRTLWLLAIAGAICIGIALFSSSRSDVVTEAEVIGEVEVITEAEVIGEVDVVKEVEDFEEPDANEQKPAGFSDEVVAAKHRPIEVLSGGFASASSCTRCHQEQHRSWHASFHRTMTQTITPNSAPPAIENDKVNVVGVDYRFIREGDRYFVEFDDPIIPGSGMVKKELALMTGSHHMSVFWYESSFDRTPAMLPVVYLRDQKRWIPRNAAFVRPPGTPGHELGRWNQVCSRCHSTHPRGRLNKQTDAWDTHVVDFGIACEACHGPGEKHIQFHDGVANVTESDDLVVSPKNLPHHLQSDVCGQCHSVHRPDFESYSQDKLMSVGMPFRPGDNFEDSPLKILLRSSPASKGTREFARAQEETDLHNSFWSDGTVRVAGREYNGLVESPCYQNGKMSCLSCHEMHPDKSIDLETWRDDQLKPGMRTNHACTQCHQEPLYTDELSQHTHHAADSHGSNCMNCHMPHTVYGLLKSVRSHRIESPSVITTLTTGRPNGCVLCHLDRTIAWTADHLTQWYGHQELELKSPVARETASGLINLLLGDAGLRAIYASTFAWEPAREASGTDWMPPYLMLGLIDQYDAVRIITKRTLQTLPGMQDIDIDELADRQERAQWVNRYLEKFKQDVSLTPNPELLIGEDGKIDFNQASQMFNARDQTPIFLQE